MKAYKDIEIKNFRGIRFAKINDLADVNVFSGKNNCGKTSLLEALFLISTAIQPGRFLDLMNIHSLQVNGILDFLSFFYNVEFKNSPYICTKLNDETNRELEIRALYDEVETERNTEVDSVNILFGNTGEPNQIQFRIKQGDVEVKLPIQNRRENGKIVPSSFLIREVASANLGTICAMMSTGRSSRLPQNLKNADTKEAEQFIDKILSQIDPNIVGLREINNKLYADMKSGKRILLNLVGDGMIKIVSILLALYQAKNGILLIDEIENGLHFKTIEILWKFLLQQAKELNVQLFVTTHNQELLQKLVENYRQDTPEDFPELAHYNVIRRVGDEIVAFRYNKDELIHSLDNGSEVRK